ncbi:PAS domain S-box protein [Lyngbya aestuarii]|uniref:PAS domain S-box protein n=1 Tax=Lyngbya aestuarii TaxID=118322 RepID=UPI00403E19C9
MRTNALQTATIDTAELVRLLRAISKISSLVVVISSCLVFVGWALDFELLKSILPGQVTMKPNTALGMLLSGAALWLWHQHLKLHNEKFAKSVVLIIYCLSSFVVFLGLLTLIQYSFNLDFGIDQLLFKESPDAVDALAEGRMAPNTALNFVFIGSALVLFTRKIDRPAQFFSLVTFFVALLALTGHLYAVTQFYSVGSVTGMAINTASDFLLVSLGILFAGADRGWMREISSNKAGGIMARRLAPVVIILPLLLGLLALVTYKILDIPAEYVIALRSALSVAVLISLVWWNARSLNQIDTYRWETQQRLIENERRFRAIFDQTYQFIGLLHTDGTLIEANRTALEFGGVTSADVVGKPFWEAPWWTLSATTQQQLKKAVAKAAQGEFVRYEVVVRGARDTVATIDFSLKPITDTSGNVILLIPEGRDISERKQAEEALRQLNAELETRVAKRTAELTAINTSLQQEVGDRISAQVDLRESEKRFRRAVIDAPFPILIHSENGEILQTSKALTEITDYTPEEIPTIAAWTEKAYGERQDDVLEVINNLYALDRRVDDGEFAVTIKDGTRRIWTFSSAPLGQVADGRRLVISMAADITQRKQAETALASRLEQQAAAAQLGQNALSGIELVALFDQATALMAKALKVEYCKVLELLPDGKTLLLRSGVGWQAGLVGQATVGTDLDSQAGYTLQVSEPVIVEDLATETRFSGPPLLREHQVVSGMSTVIRGRGLQPFGVLGVHTVSRCQFTKDDVNFLQAVTGVLSAAIASKQAGQEIQQLNETLEQRVQERTQQLKETNQELETFSYSVAHDLRAPLRGIQGFAFALLEDCGNQLDELAQDYVQRMAASAEHLDTLIQDLLEYSRLGRADIQWQLASLSAILEGALIDLDSEIQAHQAQIIVEQPLPIVKAQRSILRQVLVNLVNNAIKFVVPGVQPVVRIWAEQGVGQQQNPGAEKAPRWVRLWVEDNGIGIAPQHQERIFKAFERLHGMNAYPGTGIGLAIVYKGIQRLGGSVGVDSSPNQGSRFWIELMQGEDQVY